MTVRTEAPFRADHVGSLLRPKALLDARSRYAVGDLDAEGLREVENASILEVVRMQEEVGLRTATDGEFRRTSWHMDFIYQLGGVDKTDEKLMVHFRNEAGELDFESAALSVHERISLPDTIFGDAFSFLLDHAERRADAEADHPVAEHGPLPRWPRGHRHGRLPRPRGVLGRPDRVHTRRRFAGSATSAAPTSSSTTPAWPTSTTRSSAPWSPQQGGDAEHQHEVYIRNINAALSGRPEGMRVTTHMCRGNFRSSWAAEGGYDFVAEALFSQLEVDGFFLEYDDERSGGFAPLRFVPEGKQVVLGLVTTKKGALEDKDQLKRRIDEAAKYVSLDQLCLSPQCGFSSTVEGNVLTYEEEVAKLRLIVETAEDVWG